ncbi:MAG: L-idonate 5-dehydrogenase [Magnetospirillum sp.]|nr:L-idonate 5-dehydrogenase [Magnetospirillum sp.]
MRAVVIHAPKDLRIDTVPEAALAPNEVRVRIGAGGICGSDLHYYHHGGFGTVRVKEPMTLGHEISGTIAALGSEVGHLRIGQRVAVNPSRACGRCAYCHAGVHNQCLDMRFMGSAMRFPHMQGGFAESLTVDARQAVPIPDDLSLAEAAMAEPLAVSLHAARQAGSLFGKRVLITGCGPIGALAVLVAKNAGAVELVVTDIATQPLEMAKRLGATLVVNAAKEPEALKPYAADKGQFDVLIEATGNETAIRSALELVRPGGTVVQLGLGGDITLPMNLIVAKELNLKGTFRFDTEFELAVQLMARKVIDVRPVISAQIPFTDAIAAFELATDRNRAMKVQLVF